MSSSPQTDKARFAIVCDSACDVPLEAFCGAGVVMVPLRVSIRGKELRDCIDLSPTEFRSEFVAAHGQVRTLAPAQEDYELAYEGLIRQGWKEIVSLHASAALQDCYETALSAARASHGARISVIDSRCISGQLALVLAALIRDRIRGCSAEEAVEHSKQLAEAARMLVVPALDAHPSARGVIEHHRAVIGKAASLSARALGTRRVFQITAGGQVEERFHSGDLSRLAASCARTMSAYAQRVGALTYLEVVSQATTMRSLFERPLDTNEFESERALAFEANPSTAAQLGIGALALAFAPASLISVQDVRALVDGYSA